MHINTLSSIIKSKWAIGGTILLALLIIGVNIVFTKKATNITSTIAVPTPMLTTNPKMVASQLSFFPYGHSVNINLDSGVDQVSGIQLVISYDPNKITNVHVVQATYLQDPTILANTVDMQKGIITYTEAIKPDETPIKGKGTIAAITYDVLPNVHGITTVSFLPQTKITATGINTSVLKVSKSITIPLQ